MSHFGGLFLKNPTLSRTASTGLLINLIILFLENVWMKGHTHGQTLVGPF